MNRTPLPTPAYATETDAPVGSVSPRAAFALPANPFREPRPAMQAPQPTHSDAYSLAPRLEHEVLVSPPRSAPAHAAPASRPLSFADSPLRHTTDALTPAAPLAPLPPRTPLAPPTFDRGQLTAPGAAQQLPQAPADGPVPAMESPAPPPNAEQVAVAPHQPSPPADALASIFGEAPRPVSGAGAELGGTWSAGPAVAHASASPSAWMAPAPSATASAAPAPPATTAPAAPAAAPPRGPFAGLAPAHAAPRAVPASPTAPAHSAPPSNAVAQPPSAPEPVGAVTDPILPTLNQPAAAPGMPPAMAVPATPAPSATAAGTPTTATTPLTPTPVRAPARRATPQRDRMRRIVTFGVVAGTTASVAILILQFGRIEAIASSLAGLL